MMIFAIIYNKLEIRKGIILKKIILLFFILFVCRNSALAINWQPIYNFSRQVCSYLDVDSIKKTDKYYFYNIKYVVQSGETVVITIQSSLASSFSARIKVYSIADYENLNGDYENITANQKSKLEHAEFGSVVSHAYKYVKTMDMMLQNSVKISE